MKFSFLCVSGLSLVSFFHLPLYSDEGGGSEKPHSNLKNPISVYELYDNDGVGLGIRADVLYMNYTTPVLTFASTRSLSNEILSGHAVEVPGKMSVGCNIAASYTLNNDSGYSFETSWYHIVAQFHKKVHSDEVLLSHSVSLTTARPGSASVNGHLTINFFDLLMQKKFGWGNWVTVTPSAGLVGGYMSSVSRAHAKAESGNFGGGATVAELDQFVDFEGIGLKIGGLSSFKIWDDFKFIANLFYSAMYGLTKSHLKYNSNGIFAGFSGTRVSYSNHHGRSFFDSLIGLAWGNRFCDDSLFLDLHAGWKFQSFSDGWIQIESEFNDAGHHLPLYGQGLQAGVTFKF